MASNQCSNEAAAQSNSSARHSSSAEHTRTYVRVHARSGTMVKAAYGVQMEREKGGSEGGAHRELRGAVGEAGGGPERQQSMSVTGDVRVEDEVDGECMGRPCSIQCSG